MELKSISKLKYLLAELDVQNIDYVSWKNNHQLPSVMEGSGDIDLFVPFQRDRNSLIFADCMDGLKL